MPKHRSMAFAPNHDGRLPSWISPPGLVAASRRFARGAMVLESTLYRGDGLRLRLHGFEEFARDETDRIANAVNTVTALVKEMTARA
jgi:hypothetical protein